MLPKLDLTEYDVLGYYTTFDQLFPDFSSFYEKPEYDDEIIVSFSWTDEDTQPNEAQWAAHEFLLKNANQMLMNLVTYLKQDEEYFMEFYSTYREISYEVTNIRGEKRISRSEGGFPAVKDIREFVNYFGIGFIHIDTTEKDGVSCIGFSGGCTWDPEHGFGAAFHKLKVLNVEDQSTGTYLNRSLDGELDMMLTNTFVKFHRLEELNERRERIAQASKSIVPINTEEHEKIFDWLVKYQKIYGYRNNPVDLNAQEKMVVLKEIKDLNFRGDQLTSIPASIRLLKNLVGLSFSFVSLGDFPKEILALKQLKNLTINQVSMKEIPTGIGQLENLESLTLFQNRLELLPQEIGGLSKLGYLNLSNNKLSNLPESLLKIPNLVDLNLYRNHFTILPDFIDQFQSLTSLKLEYNRLLTLPESLFKKMPNLKRLYFQGNPLPLAELTRIRKMTPEGLRTDIVLAVSLAGGELKRQKQKVGNEMRQRKQDNARKKGEYKSEQQKQSKERTQKYAEYKKQKEEAEAARIAQRKATKKWWEFWI